MPTLPARGTGGTFDINDAPVAPSQSPSTSSRAARRPPANGRRVQPGQSDSVATLRYVQWEGNNLPNKGSGNVFSIDVSSPASPQRNGSRIVPKYRDPRSEPDSCLLSPPPVRECVPELGIPQRLSKYEELHSPMLDPVEWVTGHFYAPPEPAPDINWGCEVVSAIAGRDIKRLRTALSLPGVDLNAQYTNKYYGPYHIPMGSAACAGDTALHMAARENAPHLVYVLRQLGSDESIRNECGETARDVVMTSDYTDEMRRVLGTASGSTGGHEKDYSWTMQPLTDADIDRINTVLGSGLFSAADATVCKYGPGGGAPHWKTRYVL